MGLRITDPRVSVLRLLSGSGRPLSHTEVVERLGTGPWDQATLYRNLRKLLEAGLVRVTSHVGGVERYEAVDLTEHLEGIHPHFACRACGIVSCLPTAAMELPVAEEWRAALRGAEVQFVGVCPTCSGTGTSRVTPALHDGAR